MKKIEKTFVTKGVYWVSIPEQDFYLLCGCPADVVKHLIRNGFIKEVTEDNVTFETGPNAILLSDYSIQNGELSNLAEFPVLQMIYRQGMFIPNHPNNKGQKPILIGTKGQIKNQINYIYRGNYGLTSHKEMTKAGLSDKEAKEQMRLKLKFAFGEIKSLKEFIITKELAEEEIVIKNSITIKRKDINKFELNYKNERVSIDLSLTEGEVYEPAYHLGFYHIYREHFAIIHSGEGDGWDINNPCMSSVVIHDGDLYLIDAGPNIKNTLHSLGISINEIKGIFHTHCHDDHFSGLTALLQSDHKIEYYATKPVKMSVDKKLSALVNIPNVLSKFFDIKELQAEEFNNIEGLEVKPIFSPHPVENTMFYFRVLSDNGYKSYYHMADTSRLEVLKNMITTNSSAPGITKTFYEKVKKSYLIPADIKKIDIGGAMIHGCAEDFIKDKSAKKVLSHTGRKLNNTEKQIGERATFGQVDVLIKSHTHSTTRFAFEYLKAYFPELDKKLFKDILNCPIETFAPGNAILKKGETNNYFYLSLLGTTEVIEPGREINHFLNAGSMIGEMSALLNKERKKTYIASSHVTALKISATLYRSFAKENNLYEGIKEKRQIKSLLGKMWLFNEVAASPSINKISKLIIPIDIEPGKSIPIPKGPHICLVLGGELEFKDNQQTRIVKKLEFCLEGLIVENKLNPKSSIMAKKGSTIYFLPLKFFKDIPAVMWKIQEFYNHIKFKLDK